MFKRSEIKYAIMILVGIAGCFFGITSDTGIRKLNHGNLENTKNLVRTVQWYLDCSQENSVFRSGNSWRTDIKESVSEADINYTVGLKNYKKNNNTILAIIDTGVSINLYEDSENIWKNKSENISDGIDNDNNGYIDDVYGWDFLDNDGNLLTFDNHGNEIMSILVGQSKVPEYKGLLENTDIEVMCIRAVDGCNNTELVSNAIQYAEKNGAEICCLALSAYIDDSNLYKTMKESSMLFIVAAGNDGVELETDVLVYPAMYKLDNIITVADTRSDGKISYSSNYSCEYVDICAPGTDILSVPGECVFVSGTSISTAIVAGCCAIIRSNSQYDLKAEEIKKIVLDTAVHKDELKDYVLDGNFIDLGKAILYQNFSQNRKQNGKVINVQ